MVSADPGRAFQFVVGGNLVRWGSTQIAPVDGGTQVTESWEFLPDGIAMSKRRFGADADAQIESRSRSSRSGIPATLAALKKVAEQK